MYNNHVIHENAPLRVAYDSDNRPYFSTKKEDTESLIRSNGGTIFADRDQVTLFLMSFALARYKKLHPKDLTKREANMPLTAFGLSNQWLILSTGLAESKDLMCLKDEGPIYKKAEAYANAGFDELREALKMTYFPAVLEKELLDIANEFISEDLKRDSKETKKNRE